MAPPERSKPLHNFSLPCLKWGTQKFLRCIKLPDSTPSPPEHYRCGSSTPNGFQSKPINPSVSKNSPIQERGDFDAGMKRLKISVLEEKGGADSARGPWNLRTRRAACEAPSPPEEDKKIERKSDSPRRNESVVETKEMVKFSVSLSREEIEEDFQVMAGMRPRRRPKKRPRIVQRHLDSIFPGLWLAEITPDSYKVPDVPE